MPMRSRRELIDPPHKKLNAGPGLFHLSNVSDGDSIISTRAGVLNHSANGRQWWIESNSRRYIPAAQESVIGVVVGRSGEGWRVDIGSAHSASLDGLAFEGATKRSRPNLKIGALVYARVSLAHKDMEPELECFDARTRKSEGFGELKGGFMTRCSLKMSRLLLDPKHFLFPLLGTRFPLETAVGANGRVWIATKEAKQTITIARCMEAVDPDGGGADEPGVQQLLVTLDV